MKKEARPDIPKLEITNIGSFDSEGKPIYWAFDGKSHRHSVGIYYSDDWYLIGGYTVDELRAIKAVGAKMTDKSGLNEQLKLIISLRSDGNHVDLTDEYENGYIEGQAESITALFIEQVCEAVDKSEELSLRNKHFAKQSIRNRFNPSESS